MRMLAVSPLLLVGLLEACSDDPCPHRQAEPAFCVWYDAPAEQQCSTRCDGECLSQFPQTCYGEERKQPVL